MQENYEFMAYRAVELPAELRSDNYQIVAEVMIQKRNRRISTNPMHLEYIQIYYFAGYWFSEN